MVSSSRCVAQCHGSFELELVFTEGCKCNANNNDKASHGVFILKRYMTRPLLDSAGGMFFLLSAPICRILPPVKLGLSSMYQVV